MKYVLGMLTLFVFGASAQATVFVGDLHIKKVMCIRAPCPALTSFTSGALKPFAIRAKKGSQAEEFLKSVRVNGSETHISVTIEGQIERESLLIAENITRTENEAPEAQALAAPAVNAGERVWTGTIDAQKVMCMRAPCPATAVFANEKGVKYQLGVQDGSAAERFMDKLNNTMTGGTAHLKVRVTGKWEGRSMIIRASQIEVIK